MARWPRIERSRLARLPALLALLASGPATGPALAADAAAALLFERAGERVAERDLGSLRQSVPASDVRVFEPYEGREATFRALPFDRVLDAAYGAQWRDEQEILFRCRDGYQPSIPVRRVLDHRAWLAFERVDREGFTIDKRESGETKTIDLAPFYLVWENLDDATVRQEADYGWPYQLVEVDLIRTRDRFGAMTPPDGASARARAGFAAFRIHCSKCHAVYGQGGSVGPALDPASIAARDRDWLRRWIEDPASLAPNARMPALNPALPDRPAVVEQIIAYLEALAGAP